MHILFAYLHAAYHNQNSSSNYQATALHETYISELPRSRQVETKLPKLIIATHYHVLSRVVWSKAVSSGPCGSIYSLMTSPPMW